MGVEDDAVAEHDVAADERIGADRDVGAKASAVLDDRRRMNARHAGDYSSAIMALMIGFGDLDAVDRGLGGELPDVAAVAQLAGRDIRRSRPARPACGTWPRRWS